MSKGACSRYILIGCGLCLLGLGGAAGQAVESANADAAPASSWLPNAPAVAPLAMIEPPPMPGFLDDPFTRGMMRLQEGDLAAARRELTGAVESGNLASWQEFSAAKALNDISRATIFSDQVTPGDPCTAWITIERGQTLWSACRQHGVQVPLPLIQKINHLSDSSVLRPGQRVKIVRGVFDAVIRKSTFTLDLYLQTPEGYRVLVKRMPVGLGRQGRTPSAEFVVAGKARRAFWTPPRSMPRARPRACGQKGYPLGKEGLWVRLARVRTGGGTLAGRGGGYGIHSTSYPASIGKARSHGCVRMLDADITLVFGVMTEGRSHVRIS